MFNDFDKRTSSLNVIKYILENTPYNSFTQNRFYRTLRCIKYDSTYTNNLNIIKYIHKLDTSTTFLAGRFKIAILKYYVEIENIPWKYLHSYYYLLDSRTNINSMHYIGMLFNVPMSYEYDCEI